MADLNNNIRYPIVLDLCQEKYESIDVMQGNKDSISLDIYINENGNPVTLPAISDKIRYCLESSRPDSERSPIEKEAKSVTGNVITFDCIDEYITSYPGQIYCIVSIYNSSSGKVHKLPYGFYINIIDSPFNEDGVVHSDEFSLLSKLVTDTMELKEQVEEVLDEAEVLLPQMEEAVSNENIRKEAEAIRISNEDARIEAETIRISNENTRIEAENLRKTNTATAITNCNNAKDLANTAATNCNNKTDLCVTATENATNATSQCVTATESCVSATNDCNTATTNSISATNQCITSTTACETATESCVSATNDCKTATENAIIAGNACASIVENKVGISNTIIDGSHAFSNQHVQDNFATKTEVEACFQSVSDGKEYIASVITDKGITTSLDATFKQMGDNIALIETGVDCSSATAVESKILEGFTAGVGNSIVTGTMPDNTRIEHGDDYVDATWNTQPLFITKTNEVRYVTGWGANSDKDGLVVIPHEGYWSGIGNAYEYISNNLLITKLGITADRIVKGNTICGVEGNGKRYATGTTYQKGTVSGLFGSGCTGYCKYVNKADFTTTNDIYI